MIVFDGCDEGGVKALKSSSSSSSSSRRGGGEDAYCAACGGLIDLGTMLQICGDRRRLIAAAAAAAMVDG
jgi:hypothetical protein